jgi:hypothetical protein
MKKTFLFVIFQLLVFGSVFGQMRTENRWVTGRWTGTIVGHTVWIQGRETAVPDRNVEFTFNDNGTGKFLGEDILFSIGTNTIIGTAIVLTIFSVNDLPDISAKAIMIYRINDQKMILVYEASQYSGESGFSVELNKRS